MVQTQSYTQVRECASAKKRVRQQRRAYVGLADEGHVINLVRIAGGLE